MSGYRQWRIGSATILLTALFLGGCLNGSDEASRAEVDTADLQNSVTQLLKAVRGELNEVNKTLKSQSSGTKSLGLVPLTVELTVSAVASRTKSGSFSLKTTIGSLGPEGKIEGKVDDSLSRTFVVEFDFPKDGFGPFLVVPTIDGTLAKAILAARSGVIAGLEGDGATLNPKKFQTTVEFKAVETKGGSIGITFLILTVGGAAASTDTGTHKVVITFGKSGGDKKKTAG